MSQARPEIQRRRRWPGPDAIWRYTGCQMVTPARIAETLGGARAFKGKSLTPEALQARLRAGLPYAAVEAVAAGFEIGTADLVAVLHVPPRTLARRKREKRLRADESDRLF